MACATRALNALRGIAVIPALAAMSAVTAIGANPTVTLATSMGDVRIELFAEQAPKTVANFLEYVRAGFYDETIFHRVIEGFVVQGGGFTPELQLKATRKPVRIETKNKLRNERGTVAMARQQGKNTATSQFFVNLQPNTRLDRSATGFGYTVFGRVVEGMEVVDRIAAVQTSRRGPMDDVPILPVLLNSATLDP